MAAAAVMLVMLLSKVGSCVYDMVEVRAIIYLVEDLCCVVWRVVFLLPAASVEEQSSFESEVVTVTRLGQGVLSLG